MPLTVVQKQLALSPLQSHHVLYLFHKKYFLLFGFILLWDACMSMHEEWVKSSWWQHLLWHLFSSLKGSFWMKAICPALTTVPWWPAWDTPSTACVKSTGFTWARRGQAVVPAAKSKHGWYLHQPVFPQVLGKELVHFLMASMYNSLHVQLYGEFWNGLSHVKAGFAFGQSSTPLWQRQKHPVSLQLP